MEERVVLLLGTNIGDKLDNLERARLELTSEIGEIVTESAIYQTEPWGLKEQEAFLNQVIVVETLLRPMRIIENIWTIEKRMGRNKIEHWGPRIIDIDILFYGELIYEADDLKIPHPMLHERKFTLVPLVEIMPKFNHPLLGKSMRQLLEDSTDSSAVNKI
jgi:2-amino-4-hydroxy-6-hydroxymethyldihydropteridine diphosphokinase